MKKIIERIRASFYFHVVREFVSYRPSVEGKQIFLTFDDGPEPEVTEFVLNELAKYNAKGTFFCCGKNMAEHGDLLKKIIEEGHSVANHTYSHINGLYTPVEDYVSDVLKVDCVHPTALFRPPWGQMNILEYIKLKEKKIVLWDVESGDVTENYDKEVLVNDWEKRVKSGAIILFHFSQEHMKRTQDLLPTFLNIYSKKGYKFVCIK